MFLSVVAYRAAARSGFSNLDDNIPVRSVPTCALRSLKEDPSLATTAGTIPAVAASKPMAIVPQRYPSLSLI
jgi:hypothetical protein